MTLSPSLMNEAMKERKQYTTEREAQLGRWRADVAKMETQLGEGNLTYKEKLIRLKREMKSAETQLEKLQDATEEAWDGLRTGVDNAWEKLSESVEKAKQEFEENIS